MALNADRCVCLCASTLSRCYLIASSHLFLFVVSTSNNWGSSSYFGFFLVIFHCLFFFFHSMILFNLCNWNFLFSKLMKLMLCFIVIPGAVTNISISTRRFPIRSPSIWFIRRLAAVTAVRSHRDDAFRSTGRPFWDSLPTRIQPFQTIFSSRAPISSSKTVRL